MFCNLSFQKSHVRTYIYNCISYYYERPHPSHKIYCFRHSKKVKWLMVCRKGKAYSLNNGSIGHFSFNE